MPGFDLQGCQQALEEFFAAQEDVLLAFLLGGRAKKPGKCLHDADFGVVLRPEIGSCDFFAARLRLASDLICLLHFPEVDVAILNEAPLGLRFWALRRSRLVYCRQPHALTLFRSNAINEYVGMRPFLDGFLAHQNTGNYSGALDPDPLSKVFDFFCLAHPPLDDHPVS